MVPRPVPPMLDAHVHLAAYPKPESVIEEARLMKTRLFSVTVSAAEAPLSFELRERDPSMVRCFIGIHPSEAAGAQGNLEKLERLWAMADGVGEIGLDPKYSEVSRGSPQMRLFVSQLEVAERLKVPVQVHSRGAEELCLEALEGHSLRAVLMHWFEGEEHLASLVSRAGCYVSFGPAMLYSKRLVRIAKKLPPERVLTESDGPVSFAPIGGAEGTRLIPSVVFRLAEIWGRSFEDTLEQISANEKGYLG